MPNPQSPEDICRRFKLAMADGDLDAVLAVYDPEAVIVNRSGEVLKGRAGLKQELAPLVAAKPRFDYDIRLIAEGGDIALMHTAWTVSGPETLQVHAIEVARRQADGSWLWLIGDPFTVNRETGPRA